MHMVKIHCNKVEVLCLLIHPSTSVQVVCDHNKVFWDVCCKSPGSADNASHLRSSSLYQKLVSGQILVDSVVTLRGNHMRPYIVGDCSYPLLSFLLTPFTENGTGNPAQNFFDQHLLQGTAVIQDAIATLKGRWKVLQNLNVGLNHTSQVHNHSHALQNFPVVAFSGLQVQVLLRCPV